MYRLEYPWLLLALPLPLLVYWLLPAYQEERDSVRITFFNYLIQAAGLKPSAGAVVPRSNWLQKLIAPLCWCLVVLAVARPVFIEPPIQKIEPARDLMLALDISQSMDTPDFRTPGGKRIRRVDGVKQVVAQFIEKRKGDRIGLIVLGTGAYPVAPFTLDHATCLAILAQTQAGMAGPQTMLGDAIGLAIKEFERSDAKERVLILLTDGNDTGSRMPPRKAAEIAKQKGIVIHVVGIGDPKATGEDKVDYAALRAIADATGGQLFHGENQEELAKAYDTLDKITPQNFNTLTYRPKRQLFAYPLGLATLLLAGYHLLMLLLGAARSLFARARSANETPDADTSTHFGVRI